MEISILLLTYNHEKFIKQTLDSIIMQKINVPFEILILDDASTDNTPKILKEYQKNYPQKITLYLRTVNSVYPTKNSYFLLSKSKGKYFAFIEGDDYWTDNLKIQKQYEFLEKNQQYSACFTDLIVVDENNNKIDFHVYEKKEDHIYTLDDFKHLKSAGMTVTFFARNYFDKEKYSIIYQADKMMGDITLYMLCLLKGNIYQLNESMAAYRYVCVEGENNFNSIQKKNFYKDYMFVRYWIKLENYMRIYDHKFEFVPLPDAIRQLASQYSIRVLIRLIRQAKNKKKYYLICLIYKYLLDSNYVSVKLARVKFYKRYNWNAFIKEKLPIVIFGAGAVAAEYLDKYGWKDNILFIVDNDKKKQYKSYKGFLIKNPDEILKYKGKINVLITNKDYEKDIERQIQDMGIQFYYCYCSMQENRIRNRIAVRILGAL